MTQYCSYCGTPIEGKVTFCPNCGAHIDDSSSSQAAAPPPQQPTVSTMPVTPQQPVQTYQPVQSTYQQPPPPQGNPDADSAFFLGIGGIFCLPVILSIPAIIYGFRALQKPEKHATAIIAIVLGFIGLWPLLSFWWIFL